MAFVAAREGEPLGWCWGHLLPRPDGLVTGRLDDLVVAEQHRHEGLGRDPGRYLGHFAKCPTAVCGALLGLGRSLTVGTQVAGEPGATCGPCRPCR
ncbi:hypothetical protein [Streptomyces formicae]|uniref:hypothetical protein n=1 Tax=Streptomyces formicae TaxID=1616117 RepID=UPI0036196C88